MTDIAKIKSPSAQTVAPGSAYIVLSELLFESSSGVVSANTSAGTISVAEAGIYLVTVEGYAVGTGPQQLRLTGDGTVLAPGIDNTVFIGDALGVSLGRAIVVQASARATFGIQVLNSGAGNVTYLCALGVCRLGVVG